jgi:hypothetical protein
MATMRTKSLRYRRAIFQTPPGKPVRQKTLEEYVEEAHSALKNIVNRRAVTVEGITLECRASRRRRGVGMLVHVAAYTVREPASVVPQPRPEDDDAPVGTVPPPRGADYMDGDLLLLISRNDVIICSSSLHDRKFSDYCSDVFTNAGLPPVASMFRLMPVADADRLAVIEDEGVKQISLDATAFSATADHVTRKSVRRRVGQGMIDAFRAIFQNDPDLHDINELENVSAELVIKFDRRKKGGKLAQERLRSIAKQLVDESSDGFKITTFRDTTLGQEEVVLHKKVSVPADGKTVQREAVFRELLTYFQELKDDGHLEN